ncbi:MAG TPA: hypothetical protein VK537_09205 [Galbitalea sp.]|nr:hypothetical protein [Galbitalea sp.]
MMKTEFAMARTLAGASTVGGVKTGAVKTGTLTAAVELRPRQ